MISILRRGLNVGCSRSAATAAVATLDHPHSYSETTRQLADAHPLKPFSQTSCFSKLLSRYLVGWLRCHMWRWWSSSRRSTRRSLRCWISVSGAAGWAFRRGVSPRGVSRRRGERVTLYGDQAGKERPIRRWPVRGRYGGLGRVPSVMATNPRSSAALEALVDRRRVVIRCCRCGGRRSRPGRGSRSGQPKAMRGRVDVAKLLGAGDSLQAVGKTARAARTRIGTRSFGTCPAGLRAPAGRAAGGVGGHEEEGTGRPVQERRSPAAVGRRAGTGEVYDFVGEAGKAILYGVYDVAANTAWVWTGGPRHAAFAVPPRAVVVGDGPAPLPGPGRR